MKETMVLLLGFLLVAGTLPAQDPPKSKEEFEKAYQSRISQEYLNGVYIPRDLDDAFTALNGLIEADARTKFRVMSEADAATKLHFSLGRWMIVNWSFYEGSRLSHYLRSKMGIFHPDDMARFVIILYHRSLNRTPLNVKELIEEFHQRQEMLRQEELEQGKVISEEKRKKPKG